MSHGSLHCLPAGRRPSETTNSFLLIGDPGASGQQNSGWQQPMLAAGIYLSFLNKILLTRNMSAMARSRKKPGINGGFIFKGKTFAGTL
jgi:hypothetical protein